MKLTYGLFAFFLSATTVLSAQKKELTLEEISGTALSVRKGWNPCNLSIMEKNMWFLILIAASGTSAIDVYSYKTGEKTRTILNSEES